MVWWKGVHHDRLLESDPEPDLELNAALARLSELDQEILRLWAWDFLSGLLLFFEIELGPLPAKWRKTK